MVSGVTLPVFNLSIFLIAWFCMLFSFRIYACDIVLEALTVTLGTNHTVIPQEEGLFNICCSHSLKDQEGFPVPYFGALIQQEEMLFSKLCSHDLTGQDFPDLRYSVLFSCVVCRSAF